MTRRREPKPFSFKLTEGHLYLRVPEADKHEATADDFEATVSGRTESGRHVFAEVTIPRRLIQPLARALWGIVVLERAKVAAKEAALRG